MQSFHCILPTIRSYVSEIHVTIYAGQYIHYVYTIQTGFIVFYCLLFSCFISSAQFWSVQSRLSLQASTLHLFSQIHIVITGFHITSLQSNSHCHYRLPHYISSVKFTLSLQASTLHLSSQFLSRHLSILSMLHEVANCG